MGLLTEVAIFLAAAVVAVLISRRLKLGAVLGYLVAGIAIGPFGLAFIGEVESVMHFAELGIVLLLFVIGLELQPSRLWVLRKSVFGLGSAQVLASAVALGGAALAFGLDWRTALVVGLALSMSSTAFVLQVLAERGELTARHGRLSFSILLFQDLAVIPLLALIPLLGAGEGIPAGMQAWLAAGKAVLVIAAVIVGGRYLLRPVFQAVAASGIQEIFTAAALLTVIGTSLLVSSVGLSMSLGAFLAGVLLADSEFRHELEANIEPFKGLLLGLFFMSVGMSVDLGILVAKPALVLGIAIGLMLIKAAVLMAVGLVAGHGLASARRLAVALSQGGEFAFVLFALAVGSGVMPQDLSDLLVISVTISMASTPLLLVLGDSLGRRAPRAPDAPYDEIDAPEARVIIAGFGRVGQIVGRVLVARGIPFTALDISSEQIESVRRFGNRAYYGDASRLDLLRAAKADSAEVLVIAIDNVEASLRTAETARRHFPNIRIFARARNRFHAHRLMDLGVEQIKRETFASSLEMAEQVLVATGMQGWDARDTVATFRAHDERTLERQFAVYHDETQLIQSSKDAAQELQGLFESDSEQSAPRKAQPVFTPEDVR
jgi:monovalent cation:proton antiporter-2 (CPA2) family protein